MSNVTAISFASFGFCIFSMPLPMPLINDYCDYHHAKWREDICFAITFHMDSLSFRFLGQLV
jgi:hypothetical protein